jgi:hypothetical protein
MKQPQQMIGQDLTPEGRLKVRDLLLTTINSEINKLSRKHRNFKVKMIEKGLMEDAMLLA